MQHGKNIAPGKDMLVTPSTTMWLILFVTRFTTVIRNQAYVIVIKLYWSEIQQSAIMLLLLSWMCHLGYLASSVTMVTRLL